MPRTEDPVGTVTHLHLRRPKVPARCRRGPDCMYDGAFGLHLCNQGAESCYFRGPVMVLEVQGRRFEWRKAEVALAEASVP